MTAKHPENRRKPIEVKRGKVTVKVYAVQNRVGKTVYRQYAVVYYDGTRRRKRRFADLSEAKQEAAFVAEKLASISFRPGRPSGPWHIRGRSSPRERSRGRGSGGGPRSSGWRRR